MKYELPAVYGKDLVCSAIAGINPGLHTASSHISSAEKICYMDTLFQYHCSSATDILLAPFTSLVRAHTQL